MIGLCAIAIALDADRQTWMRTGSSRTALHSHISSRFSATSEGVGLAKASPHVEGFAKASPRAYAAILSSAYSAVDLAKQCRGHKQM